jgi:alkylated DNA repair protein (DNA oxidative demethylase)
VLQPTISMEGFKLYSGALALEAQAALVCEIMAAAEAAPFYRAVTPGGKPMSVEMTNLGPLGWFTDQAGYRYEPIHPQTRRPWPPMPPVLLELWRRYADPETPPDACLINLYREGAKMGLHQDRDEQDLTAPVLSVSLGDTAMFRLGGTSRRDATRTLRLSSGDVCVLSGPARLAYHGVDRILAGSSRLVPGGGRINLTLRRAAA